MSSLRISNSFSFKEHEERSPRGSFLRARRGTSGRELKLALVSAAQPKSAHRGHHTHRARPPAPRLLPRRPPVIFFVNGGSTSRLLCAKPAAPTQIDENEHDDPHVLFESHVVITTDTDPIDSRARGVGWVAWFALALRERARLGGKCQKAPWCCGALVMKLRSSCPPICARPARPLRCFVRCRGTAHHLRQVRHISRLLSRETSGFSSEKDPLTSRRPPKMGGVSPPLPRNRYAG